MTDGLKPEYRRAIIETLSANPKVERIVLFGSRAMGTFTPTSDIDLALFGDDLTLSDQAALTEAMAELAIPQRVDILIHHRIENQALREHIRKHGVEWFARKRATGTPAAAGAWRSCASNKPKPPACADASGGRPNSTPPSPATSSSWGVGGEWISKSLGDLVEIKHGFAFKGKFFRDDPPGEILLTPGNFAVGGGFKADKFKYYDGPVPEEFVLREGDLIITMTDLSKNADTLGYPALVPANLEGRRYLHNQRLGKVVLKDTKTLDLRYLHYLLCSKEYRHEIVAGATGTTVKHTSPERIKAFRFLLPPLPEQRAIAHILGTLDDKIELNRRMSETLEAIARALFESWFVRFEPVRRNMARKGRGQPSPAASRHPLPLGEGRSEGVAGSEAFDHLFPDSFEDSELGEIPRGWEVGTLDELAVIQGGKQLPTDECRPTGIFPVFGANGIMGYTSRTTHDEFVIAFGRVGAYCGSIHWTYSGAWINNNASSVVPKRWHEFVLQTMLEADFKVMRTGSAQPFIPNSSLAALPVIRAADEVMDEFCRILRALRLKQHASLRESRTLAALRDALLPKLISGEMRVKDAERFLKERAL
jgi:type I restriction enzyme S subunit